MYNQIQLSIVSKNYILLKRYGIRLDDDDGGGYDWQIVTDKLNIIQ
jgi:hypothetical protein